MRRVRPIHIFWAFLVWAVAVPTLVSGIVIPPAAAQGCDANGDGDGSGTTADVTSTGDDAIARDLAEKAVINLNDARDGYRWHFTTCTEIVADDDPNTDDRVISIVGAVTEELAAEAAAWEYNALQEALGNVQKSLFRPAPRTSPDVRQNQYVGLEMWLAIDPVAWVAQGSNGDDGGRGDDEIDVTLIATPVATIWTFSDMPPIRCVGQSAEYTPGAPGPAPCGRDFEHTTLVTPVNMTVQIEYAYEWNSSIDGTGRGTLLSEALDTYELTVGEVQTFITDGDEPVPPPDEPLDPIDSNQPKDDSDCDWAHAWRCGDELLDAVGDALVEVLTPDVVQAVLSFLEGCAAYIGEALGGVLEIVKQIGSAISDPQAFIDEKLSVAQAIFDGLTGDEPWVFAKEVLGEFIDLDLLDEDPAKWAGKVGCEIAVALLTGGATGAGGRFSKIFDKLDEFKDLVRKWKRDRDNRHNDPDNPNNPNNPDDPNNPDNPDDPNNPSVCPTSSFPTGTPVLMANGVSVAIEDIEAGDLVLAADPDTSQWRPQPVLNQWSYLDTDEMATLTLSTGETVSATDHHLFWVDNRGQWVELEDLKPGDALLTPDGVASVSEIDVWPSGPTLVWELTVATDHTFAVGAGDQSLLVHNQSCFPAHSTPNSPSGYAHGQSDGGPGEWGESPKRTKGVEYQERVTGAPAGTEYKVDGVWFDGFDPDRNTLLDAKEWKNFPPVDSNGNIESFAVPNILKEANDQLRAANGMPIEWIIIDEGNASRIAELFADNGIDVVITLAP